MYNKPRTLIDSESAQLLKELQELLCHSLRHAFRDISSTSKGCFCHVSIVFVILRKFKVQEGSRSELGQTPGWFFQWLDHWRGICSLEGLISRPPRGEPSQNANWILKTNFQTIATSLWVSGLPFCTHPWENGFPYWNSPPQAPVGLFLSIRIKNPFLQQLRQTWLREPSGEYLLASWMHSLGHFPSACEVVLSLPYE